MLSVKREEFLSFFMSENNLERKFIPNLENRFFSLLAARQIKQAVSYASDLKLEDSLERKDEKAIYADLSKIPLHIWEEVFRQGLINNELKHDSNIGDLVRQQFGLEKGEKIFIASEYDGDGLWAVGLWVKIGNERVILFICADKDSAKGGQVQGMVIVSTEEFAKNGYKMATKGNSGQQTFPLNINIESISQADLQNFASLKPEERKYNSIKKRAIGKIVIDPGTENYYRIAAEILHTAYPDASGAILVNLSDISLKKSAFDLVKKVVRKVSGVVGF